MTSVVINEVECENQYHQCKQYEDDDNDGALDAHCGSSRGCVIFLRGGTSPASHLAEECNGYLPRVGGAITSSDLRGGA